MSKLTKKQDDIQGRHLKLVDLILHCKLMDSS